MNATAIEQGAYTQGGSGGRIRSPLTIRELLTPVFYYRNEALLAFLIPVILAVVAVFLAQPMYVAQSRLLILLGDDYVFRSDVNGAAPSMSFDRAQIVHAEMEILTAKDLRIKAIQEVGLSRVYPAMAAETQGLEKAAEQLTKDLTIDNVPQSNVIELSVRNRDPQVAADLLNTLVKLYIERRRSIFEQSDLSSVNGQRDQLNGRLVEIEAQLSKFSIDNGFGDYPSEFATIQTQQASLASQVQSLDQQLAARSGRTSVLTQRLHAAPVELEISSDRGRSQQLDELTRNLLDLQNQRRQAAARYVDGYPLVADLDRKIAELQTQIRSAPVQQITSVRRGINPVRQQLDTQLADTEGDLAGLRQARAVAARDLQVAATRLTTLVKIGPEYRELVRKRTMLEASFSDLAKRSEDTQLSDTLSKSKANVRVIQAADPPVKGKSGRLILLIAGLALGVIAAASVILISTAFSDVMVTPRDVEQQLDVPIILTVAANEEDGRRRRGTRSNLPRASYLTYDDAKLLMRLLSSVAPGPGRVMQLVAANGEEGVSSLMLDLALLASNANARRVLLIDIEPSENGSAVQVLGESGASLQRLPDNKVQVNGGSLHVTLPVGAGQQSMAEAQWEMLFAQARRDYDLVLVDCPAMARSATGLIVTPLVDMTLIVVEAEATRAAVARNLIERIDSAGGEVIGAILNKRRFYIPPLIYGWL
jgi:succinoglycan biosynthesis transport protein ExoP